MINTDENIKYGITGIELEQRSNTYIVEWGIKHKLEEKNDETNRTDFRRQRDRILYTGGFRRLQDKTQVMAATRNGDHRTRLTHSLEVEQISTSIADALGLNRDLVSAIALGHDLGHTPFGHAVERFLNKKLKDEGGFSHAVQSVRYLNNRKPKVELSNEVFEGILKHDTDVYAGSYNKLQFDCSEYNPSEPGSLEAQVVYWADKLAYLTHDFEDFYTTKIYENAKKEDEDLESELKKILANLIPEKKDAILNNITSFETRDLIRSVLRKLIHQSLNNIEQIKKNNQEVDKELIIQETKRRILDIEEKNNINEIKENIAKIEKRIESLENDDEKKSEMKNKEKEIEIKNKIKKDAYQKGLIINFDEEYSKNYSKLRSIIKDYYIESPEIQRSDAKAEKIAEVLYDEFTKKPKMLPLDIRSKIKEGNVNRIVADYIASMTDRYAENLFINLNSVSSYYDY